MTTLEFTPRELRLLTSAVRIRYITATHPDVTRALDRLHERLVAASRDAGLGDISTDPEADS
jgi:hypothetical protein